MSDNTNQTPIKPTSVREFELALRTFGFSARESKKLASGGWPAYRPDDLVQDIGSLIERMRSATRSDQET